MKYWFDTEFIENGKTIDLMSIGVLSEDGRAFYAEPLECDLEAAGDWVKQNVIPHLAGVKTPRADIAAKLVEFMGEKPEIWAYYADYDWVALCQLFGTMMQLPKGWPMYCRDVKQLCDSLGNPKLPEQTSTEHNALADAQWCREAYEFLATRPDGGDSLREALVAAQEALQWVFTCQSYVRIHGTGIQPVPKKGNPQIVKVQLGEVRAILLSFGPKLEPVLAQVESALAAKDGEHV